MECVSPLGPVYQAGTLSGNPLAVAAGLATLALLREPGVYEKIEAASAALERMFREAAQSAKVELQVQRVGSMLTPFFNSKPVRTWADAANSDRARFGKFHRALLDRGVYWPPSQFEAGFVSLAHDDQALAKTGVAITDALRSV
jgi:glutamate-1-semialdehyde 2,1-aminomutase